MGQSTERREGKGSLLKKAILTARGATGVRKVLSLKLKVKHPRAETAPRETVRKMVEGWKK